MSAVLVLVPGQRALLAERLVAFVARIERVRASIRIVRVQNGLRSVQHLVAVLVQVGDSVRAAAAAARPPGTVLHQRLPQFAAYLVTAICERCQTAVRHVHRRFGRRTGLVVQAIVLLEVVVFVDFL